MGIFEGIESISTGKSGDVTIKVSESPLLRKIGKQLDVLKTLVVTIGYQGSTGLEIYPGKDRINVATVAMFHVFGTEDMPKRDFMRSAIDVGRGQIEAVTARVIGLVAVGQKDAIDAMSEIGEVVAKLIVQRIDNASVWAQPLDSKTADGKGHPKPLNETGLLRDSVTWAVRKGSLRGSIIREGKP